MNTARLHSLHSAAWELSNIITLIEESVRASDDISSEVRKALLGGAVMAKSRIETIQHDISAFHSLAMHKRGDAS